MMLTELIHKLFKPERPPNIDPLVAEGKHQRLRAARVVEKMERDHEEQQSHLEHVPSWEELLTGRDGEQR